MSNKISSMSELLIYLGVERSRAIKFGEYYNIYFARYNINTPKRISAFFGNILHECMYFKVLEENLNYRAEVMARVWPRRYKGPDGRPNDLARRLHKKPELIANYTYANRGGNGPVSSGDGWRYRGRGPIQYTTKDNYKALAKETGMDCVNNPDILLNTKEGVISSCHYWHVRQINKYADRNDFDGCCDVINKGHKTAKVGDAIGFSDRKRIYQKALSWFMVNKFSLGTGYVDIIDDTPVVKPNTQIEAHNESVTAEADDVFVMEDEMVFEE